MQTIFIYQRLGGGTGDEGERLSPRQIMAAVVPLAHLCRGAREVVATDCPSLGAGGVVTYGQQLFQTKTWGSTSDA